MELLTVYATFENPEQARAISKTVVGERLAACANIFQPHASIYWWDGEVQSATECAALFKTTEKSFEALKTRIAELHSYECPCIVAWEIEEGHKPYLDWIAKETVS